MSGIRVKDLPPAEHSARTSRRWRWGLGFLVVVAALCGAAWVFRAPLVKSGITYACNARGLECELDIAHASASHLRFESVAVSTQHGTPLTADAITVDVDWAQIWQPGLRYIALDGPIISATFDGERVGLYGLEDLAGDADGPAAAWPAVDVTNGQLRIETPAGRVDGHFSAHLSDRTQAEFSASFAPLNLQTEDGHLTLGASAVEGQLAGSQISGRVDLSIHSAAFNGFAAQGVLVEARLEPGAGVDVLTYRLAGQDINWRGSALGAVTSVGQVELALPDGGMPDDLPGVLQSLAIQFTADSINTGDMQLAMVEFDGALDQQNGALSGPVALTGENLAIAGRGGAGGLVFTGTAGRSAAGALSVDGALTVSDAGLAPVQRDDVLAGVSLPAPFEGHGEALAQLLDTALSRFNAGATLHYTQREDGYRFSARGPARITAANGVVLAVRPFTTAPWLEVMPTRQTVRASVALTAGDRLDFSTQLNEASIGADEVSLRLGETQLAPFTAQGLTVQADLTGVSLTRRGPNLSFSGRGTIGLDGVLPGASVSGLNLFGAVEGARGAEGWRVQLLEGRCINFAVQSAQLASLQIGALSIPLCPPDGRLVQQGTDGPRGKLVLGNFGLPYATQTNAGRIGFGNAQFEWQAGGGLQSVFLADTFSYSLEGGPRSLLLGSTDIRLNLDLGTGADPQLRLHGQLGRTEIGGTLVAANVSAAASRFDFADRGEGLAGSGTVMGLRVADTRADPLYQPVIADIDVGLANSVLETDGPLRLEASGRQLGTAHMHLTLPAMDGTLNVDMPGLAFRPRGLQPHNISEHLRGFFTDASGGLDARAQILIDSGELVGTGHMEVRDFGFQTVGLGRVSGVAGRVEINDLLGLNSPPDQTITIGEINPGIPLQGGQVVFQLTGGGNARLQAAQFPFAGGQLYVEPVDWMTGASARVLTLRADNIALAELTEQLGLPGLDADGTVSGGFPIAFEGSNVFIRNARLAADSAGGTLRYIGETTDQAGRTNESVALAFQALRDFRFSVLEIGADGNLNDFITVTARLEGHNPDVLDGLPFNFNISVDSQLRDLLRRTQQLTGTDWLAEISAQQTEDPAHVPQP